MSAHQPKGVRRLEKSLNTLQLSCGLSGDGRHFARLADFCPCSFNHLQLRAKTPHATIHAVTSCARVQAEQLRLLHLHAFVLSPNDCTLRRCGHDHKKKTVASRMLDKLNV